MSPQERAVGAYGVRLMWMGTTEACEYLGIRLRTLYKRIDIGEITAYRHGRTFRIRREDLDDYLERVRVRPGDLAHLYKDGDERDEPAAG